MNTGRVVVITGATGGIGALIVQRFLANGDTVVATDRSAEALGKLAGRFDTDQFFTATADIADQTSCHALGDFVSGKAGRVDILINCAGFFPTQPFDEMTLDDWNKVIGINLTGVFLMIKSMLPLMRGRGWGRIINIGSASMFQGVAVQAHYVAAKAGVMGLTRSLARAFGGDGITVNIVTPGLTATARVRDTVPAEMLQAQVKMRAIQRDETPEDLIGAIFFLASPDADFMSGQTVNVDGGKFML
jgi:NAD(P)-dependent dehydrogenase (short-subunit alcohol dehydrogenase family)